MTDLFLMIMIMSIKSVFMILFFGVSRDMIASKAGSH